MPKAHILDFSMFVSIWWIQQPEKKKGPTSWGKREFMKGDSKGGCGAENDT